MLAAAAVFVLARDHKALQRLDFHDSGTLDDVVVNPQAVQQLSVEERPGNHNAVGAADLLNQPVGSCDDLLPGFRLPRVCVPAL